MQDERGANRNRPYPVKISSTPGWMRSATRAHIPTSIPTSQTISIDVRGPCATRFINLADPLSTSRGVPRSTTNSSGCLNGRWVTPSPNIRLLACFLVGGPSAEYSEVKGTHEPAIEAGAAQLAAAHRALMLDLMERIWDIEPDRTIPQEALRAYGFDPDSPEPDWNRYW